MTEPITDCTDISPDLVMYRRGETVTLTLTDPLTLTGRQAAQLGAPS